MATTKRDRQRANRELRQAELKKRQTRATIKSRTIRWSKIGLVVVVLFFLSNLIFNSSSDEPVVPTTTTLVEVPATP
jgi:hypothetical protein